MLVEFTGQKSSKDIDMFRDVRRRYKDFDFGAYVIDCKIKLFSFNHNVFYKCSTKEHFDHPVRSVLNGGLIRGIIIRVKYCRPSHFFFAT